MKVLIIGYGVMGNRYAKYLDELEVEWSYYDPYVAGGIKELINLNIYSHIIISTPPENHYECYKQVMDLGFTGRIYVDKPIIISKDHMDIFDNDKVFCGMTERYNPAVIKLKELLDPKSLISLKFSRYSTVPANIKVSVMFDLGIHDLDIYTYLLNWNGYPDISMFKKSKTHYVMTRQNDILSIFEWSHESHRRERKITALQKDVVYEADLIDQTVLSYEANCVIRNLYVDKFQPLKEIIQSFLNGDSSSARPSHEFMFKILNEKEIEK